MTRLNRRIVAGRHEHARHELQAETSALNAVFSSYLADPSDERRRDGVLRRLDAHHRAAKDVESLASVLKGLR